MKSLHHLLLIFILIVMVSGPVLAGPTTSVLDQKKTILVDLSHAERVMVDGTAAPDLDRSQNPRVLNWQDWANDMRSQGYDVRTLMNGPVTAEKLAGTCLVIIAEPDMGKNGIAYFTADEAKAIAEYVSSGHALLLMGHTFLGGPDKQSYRQDYTSNYVYALIQNDLLKKMKVNMKFTADAASRPIGDIMIDPDSTDMVQGSMSDIWVHEGEKSHEVWKDVPEGRFAYFHGSSIDLPPKGGIAYGDAATFTTRDTTSVLFQNPFAAGLSGESGFMKRVEDVSTSSGVFGLVAKKQGDYPVAIAETRKGCGIIMLYGDSAAWQNSAYWGSVYTNEAFHEKTLAHNIVTYLTKHCEDCVTPAPTAAKAKTAPTKVILTPKAGVTVKNNGNCISCMESCDKQYPEPKDLKDKSEIHQKRAVCYSNVCKAPGDIKRVGTIDGISYSYSSCSACSGYSYDSEGATVESFSSCMKELGCTCPQDKKPYESCANCIDTCVSKYKDDYSINHCIARCDVSGFQNPNDGSTNPAYCKFCQDKFPDSTSGYTQCLKDNNCQCPLTPKPENCNSCLSTCKTGDTTCVQKCEADYGATGLCDCATCQAKCGSDMSCLISCINGDGKNVCGSQWGGCLACIDTCNSRYFGGQTKDVMNTVFPCMNNAKEEGCKPSTAGGPANTVPFCGSCWEAAMNTHKCKDNGLNDREYYACALEKYRDCMSLNGCSCPSGPDSSPGPDRTLDCAGCIGQCNGKTACSSQCKDSSGNSCLTASVIPPGTTSLVSSTGSCTSCITSCNEKTVSGVSLTDTELKQCYTACGSGLCENTWTSCGGAGGFTVIGPAGIVGTNINPRATETPALGAILSTSANPRATVTPDTGSPSKFSQCTGYEAGQLGYYYCSDCNACTSYLAKGYQCSCEKNTEGLNPQPVTTADFTPGLRECYLSAMQGSSCSCPAPTPRPTARVLDIPQMTLVITKTPTATPQSRPTARVLPLSEQTIIITKTPTPTPTPASLTAKAPAICTECMQTCKGMIGSKYTKCLGDCAEQKGQARSACIPKMTLPPTTPQKKTVPDFSAYGSGSSGQGGSTDPGTGSGGTTSPDTPPVHLPICFDTCIPGACRWVGDPEFGHEECDPPICFTTCI